MGTSTCQDLVRAINQITTMESQAAVKLAMTALPRQAKKIIAMLARATCHLLRKK